ncbi:hypothetical protein CsSME_00019536 [Camellia sinensis var. sinensis]
MFKRRLQIMSLFTPTSVSPNLYFENPILSTAASFSLHSNLSLILLLSLKSLSILLQVSDSSSFFFSSVIHLRIAILKFDFEHSFVIYLREFGSLRLLRSKLGDSSRDCDFKVRF